MVTVHSVLSNTLRDAQNLCLGFSVTFAHKKHLAGYYQ